MNTIESVCVYCGSSNGRDESHFQAGLTLGRGLADAGLRLVYGAGTKGIMGAVARGTMDAGGKVTGIIPKFLIRREANEVELTELDELIVTEDMHQRKHGMFERADAFVALPGGIGTLEEIVEIMTWAQLARHEKPMVFANIGGFWNPLLTLIEHMKQEGFVHSDHRVRPIVVDRAEDIVPAILKAAATRTAGDEGDTATIDRL
ncbi:TIGR00730 family Rossman fold protein [Nitratireductor aquimarinus]|uniref:Cytokinin riboside 5'-monophosphate phosphoribohydrolase n=1 Tax=Nitratireductor aquimarinus TaxID=889300 RepID=A0ABU4AJL2_9HYPH|nr:MULTISPECIES: TIGR00730 family Rossman fold protein [Nitratireductor]MBN7763906.1 TIGR00730 family Rossman fold protein [Nitratireductor aquibiodomus]MBN8241810.1 TIGR00730 family Rossman fold protein [Nitratireductor aquimarinus]MBY6130196.1 TIGR00730 family Rossman fold protein [Nitratireductor aquimarinus]MCA1304324.1 TIGR00730 family Rossman fold protein [Nitratireductor aquimarinus]MCV0348692.1 TIGR00730 family Rossman fold protein [Nitratireductor sp.]